MTGHHVWLIVYNNAAGDQSDLPSKFYVILSFYPCVIVIL